MDLDKIMEEHKPQLVPLERGLTAEYVIPKSRAEGVDRAEVSRNILLPN